MNFLGLSLHLIFTVLLAVLAVPSLSCDEFTTTSVRKYKLCTYSSAAYKSCQRAINEAENFLLDLPLDCERQRTKEQCMNLVSSYKADMTILREHDYQSARNYRLQPVIFERTAVGDVYIAVAPRDIQLIDINEAPILVNRSDSRAFHAAALFNFRRGHDICRLINKAGYWAYVYITNSANYIPNDDEILLCPDHTWSTDYHSCNYDASLQSAVFMRHNIAFDKISDVKHRIFDTIFEYFGPESQQSRYDEDNSNFFDQFKNTSTGFDLFPTYRNFVNESVFNHLHCHELDSPHNPSILEA